MGDFASGPGIKGPKKERSGTVASVTLDRLSHGRLRLSVSEDRHWPEYGREKPGMECWWTRPRTLTHDRTMSG